ncbi:MAG: GHKL domain-containing protein [Oscillospiraceae bacterium]|nr:GHKL domain-containing protein [Oscillospiraceae bacterium]
MASLLAAAIFLLCYQYDNKYTAEGPQARFGVLLLSEDTLKQWPTIYLVDGWEIYRGKLLTPETLKAHWIAPDEFVFIGQYSGFEGRGPAREAHGSATYRLNITLPPQTRSYALELPEIYSAYKLYMNGALMAEMGETDAAGYYPQTGNRTVTVQAAGQLEILVAVSDYSHFYSGMVYPSAFGEPDAVERLSLIRLGVRFVAGAIAACLGLLTLGVWWLTRNNKTRHGFLPLYYAAACFCFLLYTGYPIVKTLFPGGMGWYRIENFAFCVMFLLIMLIQRRLTGAEDRWFWPVAAFAGFISGCSLVAPLFIGGHVTLMALYAWLIESYYWICALYLTVGAAVGVYRGRAHSTAMLAAIAVFDVALIMSRLFPLFEPIRFGWFTEWAGAVVVLTLGFVLAEDIAGQVRQNRAMEIKNAFLLENYETLEKHFTEIARVKHDTRHHLFAIRTLLDNREHERLAHYLSDIQGGFEEIEEPVACGNRVIQAILGQAVRRAREMGFSIEFEILPLPPLSIPDADLVSLFTNLLDNALESCAKIQSSENRWIKVRLKCRAPYLILSVSNARQGTVSMDGNAYISAKDNALLHGHGIAIVKKTAEKHGGFASFEHTESAFAAEAALLCGPPGNP